MCHLQVPVTATTACGLASGPLLKHKCSAEPTFMHLKFYIYELQIYIYEVQSFGRVDPSEALHCINAGSEANYIANYTHVILL